MILAFLVLAAQMQPQVAIEGSRAALVYGEDGGLRVRTSDNGGRKFGPATSVPFDGKLAIGKHRGPRVAVTRQGIVVSAIVDGNLLAWRSADGKQWSNPVKVNGVDQSAREGLHGMAAGGGSLVAVWLDLRSAGTKVYSAVSKDGGASWSGNSLVYESPSGNVCECCHPSIVVDGKGVITVMFRNWLEGARDMYWTRSSDGGKTWSPARQFGTEHWMLNACPMDGGSLALDPKGKAFAAYRRENTIYTAMEDPASEAEVGPGGDPAATASPNVIFWVDPKKGLMMRAVAKPAALDRYGRTPVVVAAGDGEVLAAWEHKDEVVVERLKP